MLSVEELLPYYPENQRTFREFILREYLQHKILQIVFDQRPYANQLCFLGGTCLRIVHGNTRFSEDIDFDNFGLTEKDFQAISATVKKELEREGYKVEMRTVLKGAFHCHVQFPGLLFKEGLSGHREQKILIQLDTEPQHFDFQPEMYILNKFDVFTEIPVTPPSLLLAQKFYTILNRKRSKGRDFYDVVFLLSRQVKPNYDYLKMKVGVGTPGALRDKVNGVCSKLDMGEMAKDVAPFLFHAADSRKVESFVKYLGQTEL